TRLNRLVWSYLPDWVLVIIMALAFFAIDKIHPFRREFSLEDKTIQHPMKPDTVTPTMLIIISFVIPIVVIFFNAVFIRRSWFDLHQGWLGCMLALTLTIMVTHTLKVTVGRLRPDFIDRCKLDRSNGTPTDPGIGLSNSSLCTQTNSKILRDGMKSFPSGHSSMTFAGMTYLTLYLAGKLHIHDQKGHTIKTFITIMPLLGAALVAVSRTCDYRHHWQDVTIGSIIGILCAYFAYRQYYPRLASLTSHRPYSPRIPADDDE
ncbi:phosphatidic acid phosphatase type 2/haloperoxidase, partial [Dimargaris cristalligena]